MTDQRSRSVGPEGPAEPVGGATPPAAPAVGGAVHADALAVLGSWSAPDTEQDHLRRGYLEQLHRYADATDRGGPPEHLTVGVLVLDPDGRRVLLTHHRKADAWFQFGGHIEPGDAGLRAAAARELAEESGLPALTLSAEPVHLDRHPLPGAFGRCREHLDVRYAAVAPSGAVPVVSEESHDVRWFAIDELPPAAARDLAGLIVAGRRWLATRSPRP